MWPLRTRLLLWFIVILFLPCISFSQVPTVDSSVDSSNAMEATPAPKQFFRDYHEPSVFTGQSFGYPEVLSALPDQRMAIVGVRWTSHFFTLKHTTVNWSADLKPLALHSNDYYKQTGFTYIAGPRQYTYGGGGGIGVQLVPRTHWRCQLVFDVDGGFLAFTKETPIPNSRRVNITFDFGPGLYLPTGRNRSVKLGAQFFHFSNADTVPRNPRFDTIFLYVAFTFRNIHLSRNHDAT